MSEKHARQLNSRRTVLRAGLASMGHSLLPSSTHRLLGDDARARDFIDAHVHVWTGDTDKYPLHSKFTKNDMRPATFTPEQLFEHARPSGVERIVLIQMSFYGFDNSYMLDAMRAHAGTFSGVAVIDENDDPCRTMKRLAGQGVRGFRIQPGRRQPQSWLAGDGMKTMWKCGADLGLAMCLLINPEFLPSVDQMCRKYPQTPVVIDHFARIGIDGTIRDNDLDNLCRLARYQQVTIKVSAFYALGKKQPPYRDLLPMIRRLLDAYGARRLMWASDCPFQVERNHSYKASIDLIRTGLDSLSDSDRQWLLRRTAERVFFS